jgi:hypothetical protein
MGSQYTKHRVDQNRGEYFIPRSHVVFVSMGIGSIKTPLGFMVHYFVFDKTKTVENTNVQHQAAHNESI